MKFRIKPLISVFVPCLIGLSPLVSAQDDSNAHSYRPQSSIENQQDVGHNSHTHLHILMPQGGMDVLNNKIKSEARPYGLPPYSGYFYETPASLGCIYGLTTYVTGCNPQTVTTNPVGGSKAIAIVDAYNYTTAQADLDTFSNQFGLPSTTVNVVYANGTTPPTDTTGWSIEAALDLQMAHAMSPNAKIFLILAASSKNSDLLVAVDKASTLVANAGGGQISMSWGGSEFRSESNYDTHFQHSGVVYIASAGDSAGTSWPSISPYVVGLGGTTVSRDSTGSFLQESAWSNTGGGSSKYYSMPAYQKPISSLLNKKRGGPDTALDANPNTGVWVYYGDTSTGLSTGWYIVGGTSVAAPLYAGMINATGSKSTSSTAELTTMYSSGLGNISAFNDITHGSCGPYASYLAGTGWDFCTGMGSVNTYLDK